MKTILKWHCCLFVCFFVLFSYINANPKHIKTNPQDGFLNSRFGMFIHFGLYAVPAGVWENDTLPSGTIAEHIMRLKSIPREEYHQLTKKFNPSKFNAREIVSLAKQTGMKYIVFTAKHHDGFAMFDSDYDDYNIKDGTPYEKDILKELSEECIKQDIKLGLYYSHIRDWDEYHSVDKYGNNWDWDKDDPNRNTQIYLDKKVKIQLKELLTNYGEIFCLWFDTPGDISKEQAKDIYDYVKKMQPNCLINTRIGAGLGDFGVMGDNQIPPGVLEGIWECPATLNHSWGFHCADTTWKSAKHLIMQLVDLSSKNINYLLNIGPKADGSIPRESVQRLKELGEWVEKNGEAIYNTKPSPWFQEMDGFRITRGKEILYLTLLNSNTESVTLFNLKNDVFKITGIQNELFIPFKHKQQTAPDVSVLKIDIPKELKNKSFPVIKIHIKGSPKVDDRPCQMSSGNILLQAGVAKVINQEGHLQVSGIDGIVDTNNWPYFATQNWHNINDYLEWKFIVTEPGEFDVNVVNVSTSRDYNNYKRKWEELYQDNKNLNKVRFSVNNQIIKGEITGTKRLQHFRSIYRPEFVNHIGTITLETPGIYYGILRADFINPKDEDGLVIYEVKLEKKLEN